MPIVTAFMGGESVREAKKILRQAGIPTFATPERAVRALQALTRTQTASYELRAFLAADSSKPAAEILKDKTGLLDEQSTAALFSTYVLPLPKQALAKTAEEAVQIAEQIGYPVIAKISSPDILHKTDIGGVRANLKNAAEVITAFNDIMRSVQDHFSKPGVRSPQPVVNGILIQQFLPVGNEFIVGAVRDPSFGPLVMVGLGGIYTELFRDSCFRIAPVDTAEAYHMLSSLESWKLLLGMRGKPQADIDALAQVIVNVSRMMLECPQITELDLNPVLVRQDGVLVADAKVVIG
jgi:acetate---CoA ligase (ADP-forming)